MWSIIMSVETTSPSCALRGERAADDAFARPPPHVICEQGGATGAKVTSDSQSSTQQGERRMCECGPRVSE